MPERRLGFNKDGTERTKGELRFPWSGGPFQGQAGLANLEEGGLVDITQLTILKNCEESFM
ncbi:MAG: hypothetical protein VCB26_09670 [Candidatus Hydrogenedentota bacterium]